MILFCRVALVIGMVTGFGIHAAQAADEVKIPLVDTSGKAVVHIPPGDGTMQASLPIVAAGTPATSIPTWGVSEDDYPRGALIAKMEGTVRFVVSINETGAPVDCTILKSSGHELLDSATCKVVINRGKFRPARDAVGAPVPGTWRHLANWVLPTGGSAASQQVGYFGYSVTVTFDGSGDVAKCKVAPLSALAKLTAINADKCRSMGTASMFTDLLGRPTAGLATATFRFWQRDLRYHQEPRMNYPIRRILANVQYDSTDDGAITWCEVRVPPPAPVLGLDAEKLCGPRGFGVTRAGGGGHVKELSIDVVAAQR